MFCYSNIFMEIHVIIVGLQDDGEITAEGICSIVLLMRVSFMQRDLDPSGIQARGCP